MTIKNLLATAGQNAQVLGADHEICGLAYDSREAKVGDLFICLKGEKADGHDFAPKAYARGVRVFLVERELDLPPDTTQIIVFGGIPPGNLRWWGSQAPTARPPPAIFCAPSSWPQG